MYKYFNLILCALYMFCLPCFSTQELEENQIDKLATTLENFQEKGNDKIWPNFTLNELPSVVHFENGHIYSFNLPESKSWELKSIAKRKIAYTETDKWEITKLMMHPSFPIDDVNSFVFRLDLSASSLNLPLITFVHERFHLYQFAHFNRDEEKTARYANEWDEENQVLSSIENWTLVKFLQEESIENKKEWLKNYVAVSSSRTKLLDRTSLIWEDLQQRMEGLADYAALKTYEVFPLFDVYSFEKAILEIREKKTAVGVSIISDIIKGRHYFVGAALGAGLDVLGVDWKKKVEKGTSMRKLLIESFDLSDNEISERLNHLKNTNEYSSIAEKTIQKLENEKNKISNLINSYENADGILVQLGRPLQPISGGGKNKETCQLGDGFTLSTEDTSFSSSEDQCWNINFYQIPHVFENPLGERRFKVNTDTTFEIDNKEVSIEELNSKPVKFKTLFWKDSHSEFSTELPGAVCLVDDIVYIDFD